MTRTPAQDAQRDVAREMNKTLIVTKTLRHRALTLANTIADVERRTQARSFCLYKGRTSYEIESFIERMSR